MAFFFFSLITLKANAMRAAITTREKKGSREKQHVFHESRSHVIAQLPESSNNPNFLIGFRSKIEPFCYICNTRINRRLFLGLFCFWPKIVIMDVSSHLLSFYNNYKMRACIEKPADKL